MQLQRALYKKQSVEKQEFRYPTLKLEAFLSAKRIIRDPLRTPLQRTYSKVTAVCRTRADLSFILPEAPPVGAKRRRARASWSRSRVVASSCRRVVGRGLRASGPASVWASAVRRRGAMHTPAPARPRRLSLIKETLSEAVGLILYRTVFPLVSVVQHGPRRPDLHRRHRRGRGARLLAIWPAAGRDSPPLLRLQAHDIKAHFMPLRVANFLCSMLPVNHGPMKGLRITSRACRANAHNVHFKLWEYSKI
ncbi:unnamed protein product, partial [Iphiclides podalirius]